jgi:hypothetical protein
MVTINGIQTSVSGQVPLAMIRPRTAVTDSQGMFEFKELPAGTYRLSANPGQYSAQYISATYGAKRANAPGSSDPGQPISLADGQAFTATVALFKGSVITGRVGDENGDPLARVQVYTLFYPVGSTRGQRFGSNVSTDDLGNFCTASRLANTSSLQKRAAIHTFSQTRRPKRKKSAWACSRPITPGPPTKGRRSACGRGPARKRPASKSGWCRDECSTSLGWSSTRRERAIRDSAFS